MERGGTKPDTYAITCILHACACNGSLEAGKDVHCIRENNMESNLFVCNPLMDMYAKCGSMEDALSVFSQMHVRDIVPSKPWLEDLVSWTVMIAGNGMHGYGREAVAAFNSMRDSGIEPDEVAFISILYVCSHSGLVDERWRIDRDMKLAEKVAEHNFELEPENTGYYVLLANIYSEAERWEEVKKLRGENEQTPLKEEARL
ncbi:E motif [Dillenia turbinata]|uniref:E motif n=1 Tax=Dillenia turbinata TaxID=194707 RepID=A0AAN8VMP4_9MAGN